MQQTPSAETMTAIKNLVGARPVGDIVADAEAHAVEANRQTKADAATLRRCASCLARLRDIARQCEQEVYRLKGFGSISAPSEELYANAAILAAELERMADEMYSLPTGYEEGRQSEDPEEYSDYLAEAPHRADDEVFLSR